MALDKSLLEVLACPEDKGPLLYFHDGSKQDADNESFLYNPRLKRKYRIENDVPVLLIEEAVTVSTLEHETLLLHAKALGLVPNL
jgi:uncharacterized protein YbaR (Trm112 family)